MAENIFRLKRIAKKDPYVTPNTAVEKHIYDAVHEDGSGDGAWLKAVQDEQTGEFIVNMPIDDVLEAFQGGALGFVVRMGDDSAWMLFRFYFEAGAYQAGMKRIYSCIVDGDAASTLEGTENESGKTVFRYMG